MRVTVIARPLPGGRWLLQASDVPSVAAVVDTLDGATGALRGDIAHTTRMDVVHIDLQLRIELAARAHFERQTGEWAAEVPLLPGKFSERTTWYDYIPALVGDTAPTVLGLPESAAFVEVTVDPGGPYWVTWSEKARQFVAGVYDAPTLVRGGETADAALRSVIDLPLPQPGDAHRRHPTGLTTATMTPELQEWLCDVAHDARTYEPGSSYTSEQVRAHVDEIAAHEKRREQMRREEPTSAGNLDLGHPPEPSEATARPVDEPEIFSVDAIYAAITASDKGRLYIAAALRDDPFGIVALNLRAALARGVNLRTQSMMESALEIAKTEGQSLMDMIRNELPDTTGIDEIELPERERCSRVHVDDLRTHPDIDVTKSWDRVTLSMPSEGFLEAGATLDEALTAMVASMRDLAADDHTAQRRARDTALDNLVRFIELSSDNEVKAFLVPSVDQSDWDPAVARTNRPFPYEESSSASTDAHRRRDAPPPGEVLRTEFMEPQGTTVEQLAALSGVPADRLASILDGSVRLERADAIAIGAATGSSASFWRTIVRRFDEAQKP